MSLSGAMCSVMMYSNLALGATNNVTLEFSTPHGIAPDGVLLCATALDHRFDRARRRRERFRALARRLVV